MDNKACNKVQPAARKGKKKQQVKDEFDRIKQAEKKRRRLEKALATSAAIRSELEQKKQKKKEEQQRLDEEGAAIAEAVALNVLLDEDSDDSCKIMLNKEEGFNPWDYSSNLNLFRSGVMPRFTHRGHANCEGRVSGSCRAECEWTNLRNSNWSIPYGAYGRDLHALYSENGSWGGTGLSADLIAAQAVSARGGTGLSADLIAAQAVSALHITEDTAVDTIVLNVSLNALPCSSTMADLTDSATDSLVNPPSSSFRGISNPTFLLCTSLAFSPWSFNIGSITKTLPNPSASITEFQPQ